MDLINNVLHPNKHFFRQFIEPVLLAVTVLGIIAGIVIGFYINPRTGILVGSLIVTLALSIRNWIYFSLLDGFEAERTDSLLAVLPWLIIVWIASFSFVEALVLSAIQRWMALALVSLGIGFVNVWFPRYRRLEYLRQEVQAVTQQEDYKRLKKEYYDLLGEREPNWNSFGLSGERIIELKLMETLAIYAAKEMTKTDTRSADIRSLMLWLSGLPVALATELVARELLNWWQPLIDLLSQGLGIG